MTHIKICGLQDPTLAYHAAKKGADYIGLVFHPESKRYVDIELAKEVAWAIREGGAEPVAVFVNQTAKEILTVCEQTNINVVQLHGDVARQSGNDLPSHLRRIYVLSVNQDGYFCDDYSGIIVSLNKDQDYLLIDNQQAGSGQAVNLSQMDTLNTDCHYFLAGGMTADNVNAVIKQYQPYAVDVSSGVEDQPGVKSLSKINQFIETVQRGVS